MSEKIWYLKRSDLFRQLASHELAELELRCRSRNFPRKSPIYLPADEADAVLLLARGKVKICHLTPDGKQAILAFIEPGELFGELALLQPNEREEYAEAVDPSLVILIPRQEIERLMERHPGLSLGVTKLIGLRRQRIERRLKYLLFRSNRDRLVHLLLELAEQYGTAEEGGVGLRVRLSHQDLANIIGSTRETVTVLLGELQQEGLVSLGRKKIVIQNVRGLAESVNTTPPPMPAPNPGQLPAST